MYCIIHYYFTDFIINFIVSYLIYIFILEIFNNYRERMIVLPIFIRFIIPDFNNAV